MSSSRTSHWKYTGESSPPSLAPKVLELLNRYGEAGVILKDVSLEVRGGGGGSSPPSLAPKALELVNRFGEGWCHPQGRLLRGPK
jgi:hypothetical protein